MRRPARGGFTLIELAIVIGIILVLISLSVGAVMKALNIQQRRNTEQTILKTDKALQGQWKAVIDQAKTEQVNAIAAYLSNGDDRRARVIHILMCLRREFPINFQEATQTINFPNVGTFGPNQAYVRALSNASAASLARSPEDQSSACLYLTLKQTRGSITFDPDTGLAAGQELIDPFSDGIKEIADGFSSQSNAPFQPIIFNRWPAANGYGSPVLNLNGPQAFNPRSPADTEDPEGLLVNQTTWMGNLTVLQQQQLLTAFQTYVTYPLGGQGLQYRLTPVIMSKGTDGVHNTADDLYNFQLGALGGTNN